MSETVMDFRKNNDDKYRFDVNANEDIPDTVVALQQGDTPIFSIGDISTITGLPKSRKTFLITALAVAFLRNDGFMSLNSELPNKRLLIIDTEQTRVFVQFLIRRIYRLMGWNFEDPHKETLRVLSLREISPEERFKILCNTISDFKPQLVFIDGSADLLINTNDEIQSTEMVQNLMRLASVEKCHICSVVHTNPNSEKTRGHFGSELQRKSETVMLVYKEADVTTAKPQFCRSIDFVPFSFVINEKGLPEQCATVLKRTENLKEVLEEIYSYAEFLSYGDLRNQLMAKLDKGKTACENRIARALNANWIYRDLNGNYRLKFDEDDFVKNDENELPF
ncbi:MAG: AAA family ATPase [Weeksellaceae bacterium]|nr:AAA family ATPase [Weeksellaceae bacterium]